MRTQATTERQEGILIHQFENISGAKNRPNKGIRVHARGITPAKIFWSFQKISFFNIFQLQKIYIIFFRKTCVCYCYQQPKTSNLEGKGM